MSGVCLNVGLNQKQARSYKAGGLTTPPSAATASTAAPPLPPPAPPHQQLSTPAPNPSTHLDVCGGQRAVALSLLLARDIKHVVVVPQRRRLGLRRLLAGLAVAVGNFAQLLARLRAEQQVGGGVGGAGWGGGVGGGGGVGVRCKSGCLWVSRVVRVKQGGQAACDSI